MATTVCNIYINNNLILHFGEPRISHASVCQKMRDPKNSQCAMLKGDTNGFLVLTSILRNTIFVS